MTAYYAADDFALSESGDRAVLELAAEGALDGASVMATHLTAEAVGHVRELDASTIEIGLHLNLTEGAPVSPPQRVPSLVNSEGHFLGLKSFTTRMLTGRVREQHIETELRAQWHALSAVTSRIDYIDGHQHVQYFPLVCDKVLQFVARETTLGEECVRLGPFFAGAVDFRTWVLSGLGRWLALTRSDVAVRRRRPRVLDLDVAFHPPASDVEVVVHPAHPRLTENHIEEGPYSYEGRRAQFVRLRSERRTRQVAYEIAKSDDSFAAVDRYIADHPTACFGHTKAWRETIRNTYGIQTEILVATDRGRIVGAAPWSTLQGPLGGRYMIIAPFASYGGVLADNSDVRAALLAASAGLARDRHAMHLHLRAPQVEADELSLPGVHRAGRYISPRVPLAPDADLVWKDVIEGRARTAVRKARKSGVHVGRVGDDWTVFERIFSNGMRDLGSPFHGIPYFQALQAHFGDRLFAWVASQGDDPAAAALAIRHGDTLHYVYGQNVHALRSTNANSLLVWSMIEQGCSDGLSWLDLGRSEPGTPQASFKEQWGGTNVPIDEVLIPVLRKSPPDLVPTNPRLAFARRVWSRLPLIVARSLGPWLIRGIG